MLFARRQPPTFGDRLRSAVWPRRSFARSLKYFRWRLLRAGGEPRRLALGVACGVFAACLPILGAQLPAAALFAWMLRGNIAAALIGTCWSNPVTTPVLYAGAHVLGAALLGIEPGFSGGDLSEHLHSLRAAVFTPGAATLGAFYGGLLPLLKTMLIGSLPIALASAAVFYYASLRLITAYRAGGGLGFGGETRDLGHQTP